MNAVRIVALFGLFATSADAFSNIRGANQIEVGRAVDSITLQPAAPVPTPKGFDWKSLALGAGIGAVLVGAIVYFVLNLVFAPPKEEGEEGKEAEAPFVAAVEEEEEEAVDTAATDYQALIKILAQKVAQEVGPKVSKCAAVSSVLESRMSSFTDKAKTFLLNEMNGAAGAVLREMDAPETMLLLDMDKSVEANFPPTSILIAGVMSPTVLNLMSVHHFVQMVSVGLPILVLCICAIVIDWSQPCSIPTIYEWLFTQTALALLLVLGHGALCFKVWLGKRSLAAKALEVQEQNAANSGPGAMRDEFVGNTVVLQEALLIENGVRTSFWNNVVGLATFGWVISTIWNLVLVVGWTFVPGVVAFHPAAAEVAKGEYCGAWMTVLVMKINVLLAVLFLFLNLATVAKWICDCMIESQSFQKSVIDQARAMDKNATGLPVIELLVKAFLLRGGSDTLNSRLSKISAAKALCEKEKAEIEAQLTAVSAEIATVSAEEQTIKASAQDKGGAVAEQVLKLTTGTDDLEAWKAKGDLALAEADEKARAVREATTKAIEELWEKIKAAIDAVQNSETAKALIAKGQEYQAMVEAQAREAMATLQDPEFLNKLQEAAQQATEQAKQLADDAIAAAKDPELQKKLNQMANDAMEQAQKAAEEVAAAANDPEKRRQLQEKAQQAMEQAQAAAQKAAADIQDPEMQKKMMEAAQSAMDQAQLAAESAIAAVQDPELAKKLKEAADKAMADAQALAKQLEEAANDPELKAKLQEAADKAMKDAQEAAEKAKEIAGDPELMKKIADAAKKQAEEAKSAAQAAAGSSA